MNNKIVIKHTRIEIHDYDLGDAPRLEYMFSIWDPVCFTARYKGIEYDAENRILYLPRGMDINYLKLIFNCEPQVSTKPDPYVIQDQLPIKYLTKDERQMKILKFILGMNEFQYTKTKSQISCNATTGSGKTFITVGAICYSGARAIIITSTLEWLEQWKARILEYTPLDEKQLYMVSGSGSILKLLNRDPLQYRIFLISHATLKSYGDRHGWDKISEFFQYLQCSFKVYDEAHLYFDNMCKIDFHTNTKKTLYLTASPKRSSKEENEIYQMYFKNVPSISLFDEDKDPHVNYFAIHFNSHPSAFDIRKCKGRYGFDRNKYVAYITQRPNFMKLTSILIDMVLNMNGKVLIFIGTNKGITEVRDYIVSEFPFLEPYIGIYTSVVTENKELQLKYKIILSTTKSAGTASDISDLRVVINLAEPFKSEVLAQQTLGRCRADNTTYIDVVDTGFYFTKNYYKAKKGIFSKYAKSCKDVVMSDDELDSRGLAIANKYQANKVMCMPVFK